MDYKILEANGVDNENVDGAAFNNFISSSQPGIIQGILNECPVYQINSTTVGIGTGELIVSGFRIKILSEYSVQQSASVPDTEFQIAARITLNLDRSVVFEFICRPPTALRQDDLFKTESGVYEAEIAQFTMTSTGLKSYKRTMPVISVKDAVSKYAEQAIESVRQTAEASIRTAENQVNLAAERVEEAYASVQGLESRVFRNDKRITNLEKGLSADSWETDSGIVYVKDVPENALPYVAISKIGGMTYKVDNTLRDAKVTEVKSVGKNIFGGIALANKIMAEAPTNSVLDTSAKTIKYYAGAIQGKILFSNFKPNTRYTFLLEGSGTAKLVNLKITYTDGTIETLGSFSSADTKESIRFVSDASKSIKSLSGEWLSGYTTLYYEKCGIFEGEVFYEDFKPYVEHTIAIPESVQSLEGYGLGVDNTHYNYIDFDGKKYIRKVKKITVNADKLLYTARGEGANTFLAYINITPSDLLPSSNEGVSYGITSLNGYEVSYVSSYWLSNKCIGLFKDSYISIGNNDFTTLDEFKALCPFDIVYYSTEKTEDINIIDNFIGVEGNGTLTFENEYGYDVPSEVLYQLNNN